VRYHRPGYPARRTRRRTEALEFRPLARRHRIRHPQRRTRRKRRSHSQSTTGRPRTGPATPTCSPPARPADSTHPGPRRCWLMQRESLSRSQIQVSVCYLRCAANYSARTACGCCGHRVVRRRVWHVEQSECRKANQFGTRDKLRAPVAAVGTPRAHRSCCGHDFIGIRRHDQPQAAARDRDGGLHTVDKNHRG
jgi:hypothetical protein